MPRLLRTTLPLLLATAVPHPAAGQKIPPVSIIDVYGLRHVSETDVRKQLGFAAGNQLPPRRADVEKRLAKIKGVSRASLTAIGDGREAIVFVGIEEKDAPVMSFNPTPIGPARLAPDIVANGEALDRARASVMRRESGHPSEDVSQGHSLLRDSTARALQKKDIAFAKRDFAQLREVLKTSSDASHRSLAAEVLGYTADKKAVVPDLLAAMRDVSPDVRGNAMRALAPIALLAQRSPELGIEVSPTPFVDLLSSPVWTDRNQASMTLVQLTQSRDSSVIRALRDRAVPSLAEMAKWKSPAHANMSFTLLGRAAGVPDDSIQAAWIRGDRDVVLKAAKAR